MYDIVNNCVRHLGWEMRVDSNRRQMFINHSERRVSLRRPVNPQSTPNQELQGAATASRRRFQERSTSIDVRNNVLYVPNRAYP